MRMLIPSLLLFLAFYGNSQDCDPFFAIKQGTRLEYTHYDGKGKLTTIGQTTIEKVQANGKALDIDMTVKTLDKNAKELFSGSSKVTCKDNAIYMDITNMMNPQFQQTKGSMEMTFSGDGIVLPNTLKPGQRLADSHNEIKMGAGGATLMTMTFDIKDYVVEAQEKITTPAGVFDCYRLSYQMNTKTLLINSLGKTIEWQAKGVGLVQMESYDKKGNLESRMVLTKLER